jgi:hypothetical protein
MRRPFKEDVRGSGMVSRDSEGRPEIPEGKLATLIQELEGEDATDVKHLDKELGLKWLDEDESRLFSLPF